MGIDITAKIQAQNFIREGVVMSGSSGIRGYLLQTIVTLLDTLTNESVWDSMAVEPNNESEKVDISWYMSGDLVKVTQVKSSQNQINIPNVREWASELENSCHASKYELILARLRLRLTR
jgi:hypothetical protein